MSFRNTYDPFGWRIRELAEPALNPLRRTELIEGLLVAEAEELAAGRAHLTIVHGEPADIAEAEELNDFYDTVEQMADQADWCRLSGGPDYVTVTVAGAGRDHVLARISGVARRRASWWPVTEAPCPPIAARSFGDDDFVEPSTAVGGGTDRPQ